MRGVHRIALHQSTVAPLDPVALVDVAHRTGLAAVGLRIAAAEGVERWWARGIGSPMLPSLVDALLGGRVTVLDVGRVPLGRELCVVDIDHPYGRVLRRASTRCCATPRPPNTDRRGRRRTAVRTAPGRRSRGSSAPVGPHRTGRGRTGRGRT